MEEPRTNRLRKEAARESQGDEQGFTLIEIMVVVIIIGLMAGLVGPAIIDRLGQAKGQTAKTQINSFGTSLDLYKMDNGFYPESVQGLEALVKEPTGGRVPKRWRKVGYLKKKKVPNDPWGNAYIYMSPGPGGEPYFIVSYGSDGVEGGEEDNADIKSTDVD